MSDDPRHALGRRAEAHVAAMYEARGYDVVARNARVGRLELDLVVRRGGAVVVCEVRARRAGGLVHPAATVDKKKIARVRRATAGFLAASGIAGSSVRLDVASVVVHPDGRLEVDLYENAM